MKLQHIISTSTISREMLLILLTYVGNKIFFILWNYDSIIQLQFQRRIDPTQNIGMQWPKKEQSWNENNCRIPKKIITKFLPVFPCPDKVIHPSTIKTQIILFLARWVVLQFC